MIKQGTTEWLAERAGYATASRFVDIMAVGKTGKPLEGRTTYLNELVSDRVTGQPKQAFTSAPTRWGHENEPAAREAFEFMSGDLVEEVGFRKHKRLPWVGASADGVVDLKAGIEIKSPYNSAVHLGTWKNGMPPEHMPQVQGVMWVWDFERMIFVSFDPRMPPHLQLFTQVIERDDKYIADMEHKVLDFLAEVAVETSFYKELEKAA